MNDRGTCGYWCRVILVVVVVVVVGIGRGPTIITISTAAVSRGSEKKKPSNEGRIQPLAFIEPTNYSVGATLCGHTWKNALPPLLHPVSCTFN